MKRFFPATTFLYIQNASIDSHLNQMQEAIKKIPDGVLQLQYGCYPIITDFDPVAKSHSHPDMPPYSKVVLGHGLHHSDFHYIELRPLPSGLVFSLNPPYVNNIEKIIMPQRLDDECRNIKTSFMINNNRFILTDDEIDLDKVVCYDLSTGAPFIRPTIEYHKFSD